MPGPILSYGSLAFGLVPSLFGIYALVRPEAALKSFGFSGPSQPESRKIGDSLMRIYGIRNVAVSYLLTLLWTTGNEKVMAASGFASLAMILTDGLVSKAYIGSGEWQHWSFAPIVVGIQAGFLGWI